MSADEIENLVRSQLRVFAGTLRPSYIKPHGALYHRCQVDLELAARMAAIALELNMGLMGLPDRALMAAAAKAGVAFVREGFVDRGYRDDGSLIPREEAGSVLSPDAASHQALALSWSGRFDSLGIHGDSPDSVETARSTRLALQRTGMARSVGQ